MNVAVIYPEPLPSKKARSISVFNLAYFLAEIAPVYLFVEKTKNFSVEKIFAFYGKKPNALQIIPVGKKRLGIRSNRFFNANLLKLLKQRSIDTVYVRHLKVASFLLENRQDFKVLFEIHEMFHESCNDNKKIQKLKKQEALIYQKSDALVFINETLKAHVLEVFQNIAQSHLIAYLGFTAPPEMPGKAGIDTQNIYYIGNFYDWKGVDTVVESLQYLEGINAVLIGDDSGGSADMIRSRMEELGLGKRVVFAGFKPQNEIYALLLQDYKIVLVPNKNSQFAKFTSPLKLFEYMGTKNIIVASDIQTVLEITNSGESVYLFKAGEPKSLADCVKSILDNTKDAAEKADRAYASSKAFTWEGRARKIYRFLFGL